MSVIQLQDVTRVYRIGEVETHALRGVTLEVEEGEFTALVGPSGSGKTTLLNLIGGLDRADAGTVSVAGRNLAELGSAEITSRQVVRAIYPELAEELRTIIEDQIGQIVQRHVGAGVDLRDALDE